MQLFDTYVKPTMDYSCEIWGFSNAQRRERVHKKFIKRVLGVKVGTGNVALCGETGRWSQTCNCEKGSDWLKRRVEAQHNIFKL